MAQSMPRPASENTFQITFKIPQEWIDKADHLASAMSRPGLTLTRTDVLRTALAQGLDALRDEAGKSKKGGRS
jgi:hypothetical protein